MSNILRISDAASLALHSMVIIANNKEGKRSSVKAISEMLGVSSNHLSKVLQRLVKAGLVRSIKGFGGGFVLAKDVKSISFMDIYQSIDGVFDPSNCLLNRDIVCADCIMGGVLKSMNKQAEEYFSNTKLSDFINKDFNKCYLSQES